MASVLVSAESPPADLCGPLAAAGFSVVDHALGSVPPVDFGPLAAAVVDVGGRAEAAAAQTRRWRAELGDDLLPVVWVLPAADPRLAARGLDAGADAVLARPVEPAVLAAQVRTAARARACAVRVAARASESRLLGEHLTRAHAEADRERAALRRVRMALLERSFPPHGALRAAVSHRARARAGGDFYDVMPLGADRVAVLVGDVVGAGPAAELVGHFAARIAQRLVSRGEADPGEVLAGVNRALLAFELDDLPAVAVLLAVLHTGTGELALARAGLPAPVYVPASGAPEVWAVPGPFLGTVDASYPTRRAALRPGDRLVIGTDGTRPDHEPDLGGRLPALCATHHGLSGQPFVDAVAAGLLAGVRHDDDFTLLAVEVGRA